MHNRHMKILVLAPHADDETLGMGGTIFLKREQGHKVFVAILTGHGEKNILSGLQSIGIKLEMRQNKQQQF